MKKIKKYIFFLILSLILAPSFCRAKIVEIPVDENDLLKIVNQARYQANLPTLSLVNQLNNVADRRIYDMANLHYFSHNSPSGESLKKSLLDSKYEYQAAAELLAINFFSAQETVDGWLSSPSHRNALMSNNYNDAGVRVGEISLDGQEFTVVCLVLGTK